MGKTYKPHKTYTAFEKPLPECALSDLERGMVAAWHALDVSRESPIYWSSRHDLSRLSNEYARRTGQPVTLGMLIYFQDRGSGRPRRGECKTARR
jgi:hypothetical protein